MEKIVKVHLEYDRDTANYHRFRMPQGGMIFSKNYAYLSKEESLPKEITFIPGTLADKKSKKPVTKLRRAK